MKIRLNYWQLILLFLPFIAGMEIIHVPYYFQKTYHLYFRIVNLAFNFDLCLIICYQAYLAISFNSRPNKPVWFKINAYVPVVFNIVYFFYVVYLTLKMPANIDEHMNQPMQMTHLHLLSIVIIIFLVHSLLTFLLINTPFVSRQIAKTPDDNEKARLREDYLNPMKKLLRMSLFMFAGSLILSVVIDSIVFM